MIELALGTRTRDSNTYESHTAFQQEGNIARGRHCANVHSALRQAGEQFKQAWKSGEYRGESIGFASPALLFAALAPARREIIDRLQKTQAPPDFGQAAKDFGRSLPELEADIRALLEMGLLERQEGGKVVCPFGEIRAEFSLKRAA